MKRLLSDGSFNITLCLGDPNFYVKVGDFIKLGGKNFIVKKVNSPFILTVKRCNPYIDYALVFIVCFWIFLLPLVY